MSNDNQFDKDQEAADKEPVGLSEEAQRTLEEGRTKLKLAIRRARKDQARAEIGAANLERRNTAPTGFHKEGYDGTCILCRWDDDQYTTPELKEKAKDIKFAYLSGMRFSEMKNMWPEVLTSEVKRHARAHKWFYDKAKATEAGWSLIIRKGMQRILTGSEVIDPNQLIEALKHVDKREGKIVDLSKTEGNVTIVLDTGNVPKPQPARGIATQSNDTSNDVRLLTPTTVTVIEDSSEEMARTVVSEDGITVAGDKSE